MTPLLWRIARARVRQAPNLLLLAALAVVGLVLLSGIGLAHALAAQDVRADMRAVESPEGVASSAVEITAGGETMTLVAVYDALAVAHSTPGLASSELPEPTQALLSPALSERLSAEDASAQSLAARLPDRRHDIAGPPLLLAPDELVAYIGMPADAPPPVHASAPQPRTLGGPITVLMVTIALLAPAVTMVIAAARFDGRRRLALLRELRALGMARRPLRVLAAAEATVVAGGAALVASALWLLAGRQALAAGPLGSAFFVSDMAFPMGWAVGVLFAVVLAAAAASQALLDELDGPAQGGTRARTAAGAVALGIGIAGLHGVVLAAPYLDDLQLGIGEAASLVIALFGLVQVAPALIAAVGRRLAGGRRGPAALLGGRRLQFESVQASRAGAGVMVVAFAFGGFASLDLGPTEPAGANAATGAETSVSDLRTVDLNGHESDPVVDAIADHGLSPVPIAYRRVEHTSLVALTTCTALRQGLDARVEPDGACAAGQALRTPAATHREVGSTIDLEGELRDISEPVQIVGKVDMPQEPTFLDGLDVVVPVDDAALQRAHPSRVVVRMTEDGDRDALLSAVAEAAPLSMVRALGAPLEPDDGLDNVASLGRAALVGALVLAGAGLALTTADAALRRRETAALLFAVGTSAKVRRRTVALEVGVPLLLAVSVAVALGFELVYVGGRLVGGDVQVPWADLGLALGTSLVIAAAATFTAIAFVARIPTREVLRAEH